MWIHVPVSLYLTSFIRTCLKRRLCVFKTLPVYLRATIFHNDPQLDSSLEGFWNQARSRLIAINMIL